MTELNNIKRILDEYAFAKGWLEDITFNAEAIGEEAGELLGNIKKWKRDDGNYPDELSEFRKQKIVKELFDVLFYWTYAVDSLGYNPEDILALGIVKISSRKERGTQAGSGDER